jgi:hypothetical protein
MPSQLSEGTELKLTVLLSWPKAVTCSYQVLSLLMGIAPVWKLELWEEIQVGWMSGDGTRGGGVMAFADRAIEVREGITSIESIRDGEARQDRFF